MNKNPTNEAVEWDLEQILPLKDFEKAYSELENHVLDYTDWLSKLKPDMSTEQFKEYLEWSAVVEEKFNRLYNRISLWQSVDGKNTQMTTLKGRNQALMLKLTEAARPIEMWLKGLDVEGMKTLDDANAKRLFAAEPDSEFVLSTMRKQAKYSLLPSEEDIVSNKDATVKSPLVNMRQLIDSDLRFEMMIDGKLKKFETQSELMEFTHSEDPEVRVAAFRALHKPYRANRDKYFSIYQAVVKDWAYMAKLRGFASPIARRNVANNIPDEAIETLMKVCEEERTVFQEYFRWKAQKLGMKQLRRDDIYAPVNETKQTYTYKECVDMVLTSYDEFAPSFGEKARKVVDSQHVHSHPSTVKQSGAFCSYTAPSVTPYVLVNFSGKGRDISTIAHELGHAIHGLFTEHLPIDSMDAPLPLAETASTFGEMLLFDKLLADVKDDAEKEALLSEKMADSYASISRQNYFVKFEIAAHEAIPNGAGLDEIEQLWIDILREQFGDAVEVDDDFKQEWARIPHIVKSPFYCYAYNFGELLSLSLYARYKSEGTSFIPKIEKILAAGGSRDPQEILSEIGVDMNSAEFWRGGFTLIRDWMAQLKAL